MGKSCFIFIGRSGCGKGTQVELLMKVLGKTDPQHDILYIYTGREFREFVKGQSATQVLCRNVYEEGGLAPEFLSVYMWTNILVSNYSGNQHVVFDGTPRKLHEAGVLNSIFKFYGFEKVFIIYLDISPKEAKRRLLSRKRVDDNEAEINKRLAWYETEVAPTVSFYANSLSYKFIHVDGEKSIEEIHNDIVKKVGLV